MNRNLKIGIKWMLLLVGLFAISTIYGQTKQAKRKEISAYKKLLTLSSSDSLKGIALKDIIKAHLKFNQPKKALGAIKDFNSIGQSDEETKILVADVLFLNKYFKKAKAIYNEIYLNAPYNNRVFRRIQECEEFEDKFQSSFPIIREATFANSDYNELSITLDRRSKIIVSSNRKQDFVTEGEEGYKFFQIGSGKSGRGLNYKLLKAPLNGQNQGVYISFAKKKDVAVMANLKRLKNKKSALKLYETSKVESKKRWEPLQQIAFTKDDNYYYAAPFLSENADTLYFSSNRKGGNGGFDIYISYRDKATKEWSNPQNLGEKVNTKNNETTPYYHNNRLYFSSDRPGGMGGIDNYSIKKEQKKWVDLRWLEYPLNTTYDDMGIVFYSDESGFLISNRMDSKKVSSRENSYKFTIQDSLYSPFVGKVTLASNHSGKGLKLRLLNKNLEVLEVVSFNEKSKAFIFRSSNYNKDYAVELISESEDLGINFYKKTNIYIYGGKSFDKLLNYKTGLYRFKRYRDLIAYFSNPSNLGKTDSIPLDKDSLETTLYSKFQGKKRTPFSLKMTSSEDYITQGVVVNKFSKTPLTSKKVYLLDPKGRFIDSVVTNKEGYFSFSRLTSGVEQRLYTTAEDAEIKVLGTDYVYKSLIKESILLSLTESGEYDSKIKGHVYNRLSKSKANGVKVYLINDLGIAIDSVYSRTDGTFSFNRLAYGHTHKVSLYPKDEVNMVINKSKKYEYSRLESNSLTLVFGEDLEDNSSVQIKGQTYSKLNKSKIRGMMVFLVDDKGKIVDSTITDNKGNFSFNKLVKPNEAYNVTSAYASLNNELIVESSDYEYKKLTKGIIGLKALEKEEVKEEKVNLKGFLYSKLTNAKLTNVKLYLLDEFGLPLDSTITNDKGKFRFELSSIKNYRMLVSPDEKDAEFVINQEGGKSFKFKLLKNLFTAERYRFLGDDFADKGKIVSYGNFIYNRLKGSSVLINNIIYKDEQGEIVDNIAISSDKKFDFSRLYKKNRNISNAYLLLANGDLVPIFEQGAFGLLSVYQKKGNVLRKENIVLSTPKLPEKLLKEDTKKALIEVQKNNKDIAFLSGKATSTNQKAIEGTKLYLVDKLTGAKEDSTVLDKKGNFNFSRWADVNNYILATEEDGININLGSADFSLKEKMTKFKHLAFSGVAEKESIAGVVNGKWGSGNKVFLQNYNNEVVDSAVVEEDNSFQFKRLRKGSYYIGLDADLDEGVDLVVYKSVGEFINSSKKSEQSDKFFYNRGSNKYARVKQLYLSGNGSTLIDSIAENESIEAFNIRAEQTNTQTLALLDNGELVVPFTKNKVEARVVVYYVSGKGNKETDFVIKPQDIRSYIKSYKSPGRLASKGAKGFFVVEYDDNFLSLALGKFREGKEVILIDTEGTVMETITGEKDGSFEFYNILVDKEAKVLVKSKDVLAEKSIQIRDNSPEVSKEMFQNSILKKLESNPFYSYTTVESKFKDETGNSASILALYHDNREGLIVADKLAVFDPSNRPKYTNFYKEAKDLANLFSANKTGNVLMYKGDRKFKVVSKGSVPLTAAKRIKSAEETISKDVVFSGYNSQYIYDEYGQIMEDREAISYLTFRTCVYYDKNSVTSPNYDNLVNEQEYHTYVHIKTRVSKHKIGISNTTITNKEIIEINSYSMLSSSNSHLFSDSKASGIMNFVFSKEQLVVVKYLYNTFILRVY